MKAAARQSPNCIKKKNKIKYGENRFFIWRMEFVHTAMWHVALGSRHWIHQVAAPCNVARGSRMIFYWIRPNVRHIGILLLVSISTISPQSTSHSAPVCEILSKLDLPPRQTNEVMSIFKTADLSAKYSEEGTGWGPNPPRPLLAVPNVTAHPSTASVPITVLLYDSTF